MSCKIENNIIVTLCGQIEKSLSIIDTNLKIHRLFDYNIISKLDFLYQ